MLGPQSVKILDVFFDVLSKAFDNACLQLAGPFLGNSVLLTKIIQGQGRIGQDPIPQNIFVPLFQSFDEFSQFSPKERLELMISDLFVSRFLVGR